MKDRKKAIEEMEARIEQLEQEIREIETWMQNAEYINVITLHIKQQAVIEKNLEINELKIQLNNYK